MDADKEGFLRSARSLTQTVGRAARNLKGHVIMYADKITDSMQKCIEETDRRRTKQAQYNSDHNITPTQITKTSDNILARAKAIDQGGKLIQYEQRVTTGIAADPVLDYMTKEQIEQNIKLLEKAMKAEAKSENFMEAARLRDQLFTMQTLLKEKF